MRIPHAGLKLDAGLISNSRRTGEGRLEEWGHHFVPVAISRVPAETGQCDPQVRFEEFSTAGDFTNRTILAIGSNLSTLCSECLRRGARRFVGLERCRDQVETGTRAARQSGVEDRCELHHMDLNECFGSSELESDLAESCGQADVVFCYGADVGFDQLSRFLGRVSAELCYLETNSRTSYGDVADRLQNAGFELIMPLRTGRSKLQQGRRKYMLDKKVLLRERLEQRRYRGYRLGERYLKGIVSEAIWCRFSRRYLTPNSRYDHRAFRLGDRYVREFRSLELWNKVRRLYARIAHIPYIQECDLSIPGRLTSPMYSGCLEEMDLTEAEKDRIRPQIVEVVRQLNQAGVAHRDLHCGNIFFNEGKIRLVDLEYLEEDRRPLSECYDMTGRGLDCPLKSGYMHVFKDYYRSVKNMIGLTPRDFALPESVDSADGTSSKAA